MTAGPRWRAAAEPVAAAVHALRGSRALAAAGGLVLLLTLTEPVLPPRLLPVLTGAAFGLLAAGLLTLPREVAAGQQRLQGRHPEPRLLARMLVLPALLVLLLLPRLFLAAYGIPHLTPAAGLLLPSLVRRIGLVFLAVVLAVPILLFRQARHRLGPGRVPRPRELSSADLEDDRRELLIVLVLFLALAWLALLRDFWAPFSLLAWPPLPDSLASSRGVTALAFTLAIPATLFGALALHGELLRAVLRQPPSPARSGTAALVGAHVALLLLALALHGYDLLWIARYQAASGQ